MSKIPLVENSILEISIKVKLSISDLEKATQVYYDTIEEKIMDSQGRVWSPLMTLENIGEPEYYSKARILIHRTLITDNDFKNQLGLSIDEYTELETYVD